MRKKHFLSRQALPQTNGPKRICYSILGVLFSIVFCSCSKTSFGPTVSPSMVHKRFQSLSTDEIKAQYVAAKEKLGDKANFVGNPNWEGLSRILPDDDQVPMIVVPLTDYTVKKSYSLSMNPNGYRELVFTPAANGLLHVFVVEIHPDTLLSTSEDSGQSLAMSGYYLTYSLENNLQQGHHRTNGIADKFLQVPNTIFSNHEIFRK